MLLHKQVRLEGICESNQYNLQFEAQKNGNLTPDVGQHNFLLSCRVSRLFRLGFGERAIYVRITLGTSKLACKIPLAFTI